MFPTQGLGLMKEPLDANVTAHYGWVQNQIGVKFGECVLGDTVYIDGISQIDADLTGVNLAIGYTAPGGSTEILSETEDMTSGELKEWNDWNRDAAISFVPAEIGEYRVYANLTHANLVNENVYYYFIVNVVADNPTISDVTVTPGSIKQSESTTITATITDMDAGSAATVTIGTECVAMTNPTGDSYTATIRGANLAIGTHDVIVAATNSLGGATDTSETLTVAAPDDEINYILQLVAASIEADANFNDFGDVDATGTMPQERSGNFSPPAIILELLEPDPRKVNMYAVAGRRQRIEYLTVRTHLIFTRSLKKTFDSELYEGQKLSQWYKKELQSNLENVTFGDLNIEETTVIGNSYSEDTEIGMLYGCIMDLTVGYQTLEA